MVVLRSLATIREGPTQAQKERRMCELAHAATDFSPGSNAARHMLDRGLEADAVEWVMAIA